MSKAKGKTKTVASVGKQRSSIPVLGISPKAVRTVNVRMDLGTSGLELARHLLRLYLAYGRVNVTLTGHVECGRPVVRLLAEPEEASLNGGLFSRV